MTLVKVLLVWSMCSDVTESGTQGPAHKLQPPSSLRAGPAQAKWYSAAPSPWAPLRWRKWKGKGAGERRGKRQRRVVLRQSVAGGSPPENQHPPRTPDAATSPPSLPSHRLAQQLLEKGRTESVRRQQRGLGGCSAPCRPSWGLSSPGFLPLAGVEITWVAGGTVGWGGVGATAVETEAPIGQERE